MRPFHAFLFGFLHFSGVEMSIESRVSHAFYSDCNTFAASTDSIYAIVESCNKKCAELLPDLGIEFALPNCWQRID
jgi:hypothetical protein